MVLFSRDPEGSAAPFAINAFPSGSRLNKTMLKVPNGQET